MKHLRIERGHQRILFYFLRSSPSGPTVALELQFENDNRRMLYEPLLAVKSALPS